jgi:hypothetical protein
VTGSHYLLGNVSKFEISGPRGFLRAIFPPICRHFPVNTARGAGGRNEAKIMGLPGSFFLGEGGGKCLGGGGGGDTPTLL